MPTYYPIYLNLAGKRCVLVGGGNVAARKVKELIEAGASLHVVSPQFSPSFPRSKNIRRHRRRFQRRDLDGACLAICATDDPETSRRVARAARDKRVLLNVVDVPQLSDFIAPAVFRKGLLCVAVSSSGASPSLSGRLARQMNAWIGPEYGAFLELLQSCRQEILEGVNDPQIRMRLLKRLSEPDILELLRTQGRPAAEARIHRLVRYYTRASGGNRQRSNPSNR
ncbi:MAG: bifunctional precorrin-2 dehydrogenase/sirohydrochlorin ferrochelatase [Planctomycetes bacterium]|nr:bifunctional precorrin-2 dehydrogenase/sirohydrochlorin ferrochelatase [Planctomycetota bacterium]